jgi:hypothetical protein
MKPSRIIIDGGPIEPLATVVDFDCAKASKSYFATWSEFGLLVSNRNATDADGSPQAIESKPIGIGRD